VTRVRLPRVFAGQEALRDHPARAQTGFLGSGARREPNREDWGTVREKVTISYRGAGYEIGRGEHFYGIWAVSAPQSQPLEWWPETPEGWTGAWSRFAAIEKPGTIVQVSQRTGPSPTGSLAAQPLPAGSLAAQPLAAQPPPAGSLAAQPLAAAQPPLAGPLATQTAGAVTASIAAAAALLIVGIACGLAGLFPAYLDGASLAQQPAQLVPHVIYLAAWTASAVLILLGGVRQRAGTLLGVGTSAVTFGLFFADAGEAMASGAHVAGPGLWLGLAGWLACAAGSAVAFRLRRPGRLGRPHSDDMGPVVMLMLAALGTAAAFAPAWDSFTLRIATGATQTVTEGNAFANPAPVIVGDVAVMVALVAVVAAAALWRPVRLGAALLGGAIIPMAAQAISALIQVSEPVSPTQFATPEQVRLTGLTVSSGLTSAFWIYCAFLVALIASFAWMLIPPHRVTPEPPQASPPGTWDTPAPGAIEATRILPPAPQGGDSQDASALVHDDASALAHDVAALARPPASSPGAAAT
jgi:hypothetical protein